MFQDLDKSETISETSTIKDEEEMSDRGSDDDVVHVECPVKAEEKKENASTINGGFLEAAVQEHQMSNIQEHHQITILKLRVLGKLFFSTPKSCSFLKKVIYQLSIKELLKYFYV